jgi:hypothetical protein
MNYLPFLWTSKPAYLSRFFYQWKVFLSLSWVELETLESSSALPSLVLFCLFLFLFHFIVLEFELRASHLLGRYSTSWLTLPALFCFFWDRVLLHSPGRPGTHCIDPNSFELMILLPPRPKCWDYRHTPQCLALSSAVMYPSCLFASSKIQTSPYLTPASFVMIPFFLNGYNSLSYFHLWPLVFAFM